MSNSKSIMSQIDSKWEWSENHHFSHKGCIWVGWDPSLVEVIHCLVSRKQNQQQDFVSWVYGLHTVGHRTSLWSDLNGLAADSDKPWTIIGDFKCGFEVQHRVGGKAMSEAELKDGCEWMMEHSLSFIKSVGQFHSWRNSEERQERILSRIEHTVCNAEWLRHFHDSVVHYELWIISDHCPLILTITNVMQGGGRPFKFFNHLATHPKFHSIVRSVWERYKVDKMKGMCLAIKGIKNQLKQLHISEYAGVEQRIISSADVS